MKQISPLLRLLQSAKDEKRTWLRWLLNFLCSFYFSFSFPFFLAYFWVLKNIYWMCMYVYVWVCVYLCVLVSFIGFLRNPLSSSSSSSSWPALLLFSCSFFFSGCVRKMGVSIISGTYVNIYTLPLLHIHVCRNVTKNIPLFKAFWPSLLPLLSLPPSLSSLSLSLLPLSLFVSIGVQIS